MKKLILHIFILLASSVYGQAFELGQGIKILVKLPGDWETHKQIVDSPKGAITQLSFEKVMSTSGNKYARMNLQLRASIKSALADQEQTGCDFGKYVQIDTVLISGHKTIRWFGENCNWLKEKEDHEALCSIDAILELRGDRHIAFSSDYYSFDKAEVTKLRDEILLVLSDIKINGD